MNIDRASKARERRSKQINLGARKRAAQQGAAESKAEAEERRKTEAEKTKAEAKGQL